MSEGKDEYSDDNDYLSDLDAELESLSCGVTLDSFDVNVNAQANDKKNCRDNGRDSKKETSKLEVQLKKLDNRHAILVNKPDEEEAISKESLLSESFDDVSAEANEEQVDQSSLCVNTNDEDQDAASILTSRTDVSEAMETELSLIESLSTLMGDLEIDDLRKWLSRVENTKLYEINYRPVPREAREIEDLAEAYLSGWSGRNRNDRNASNNSLYSYLMPGKDDPKCVLLKREPIIFIKKNVEESSRPMLGHLILLNRCLFIVRARSIKRGKKKPSPQNSPGGSPSGKKNVMSMGRNLTQVMLKRLDSFRGKAKSECCHQLSAITDLYKMGNVGDTRHDLQLPCFAIGVKEPDSCLQYEIFCHSEERLRAWLLALSSSVERNQTIERETKIAKMHEARAKRDEDAQTGPEAAAASMKLDQLMSAFVERGEKLEETEAKSNKLQEEASEYHKLTKQMKEKMEKKNKNWFGI